MGKHFGNFADFVQEPPVVEVKGGIALFRYRAAPGAAPRAMSLRTLARTIERCQKAVSRHTAGEESFIVDE